MRNISLSYQKHDNSRQHVSTLLTRQNHLRILRVFPSGLFDLEPYNCFPDRKNLEFPLWQIKLLIQNFHAWSKLSPLQKCIQPIAPLTLVASQIDQIAHMQRQPCWRFYAPALSQQLQRVCLFVPAPMS